MQVPKWSTVRDMKPRAGDDKNGTPYVNSHMNDTQQTNP